MGVFFTASDPDFPDRIRILWPIRIWTQDKKSDPDKKARIRNTDLKPSQRIISTGSILESLELITNHGHYKQLKSESIRTVRNRRKKGAITTLLYNHRTTLESLDQYKEHIGICSVVNFPEQYIYHLNWNYFPVQYLSPPNHLKLFSCTIFITA